MDERLDPGDMLAWLDETFYEMEANGEIAILIGHIPPGSDSCLNQWAQRYRALMDRYQNVIRLQFFGHVHSERHNTIRAINTDNPVGINFWSGALTTYTAGYPSFRRFVVDAATMLPIRVETYRMDVEADEPEFVFDHDVAEKYGMKDYSPASFDDLSNRMLVDE